MNLPGEAVLQPLATVRFVRRRDIHFDYTTAATEAYDRSRRLDAALDRRAELAVAAILHGRRVAPSTITADGARLTFADDDSIAARSVILACGANFAFPKRWDWAWRQRSCNRRSLELPQSASGDVEIHFGSKSRRRDLRGRCP